ncbi:MAG: DEAD/DEAH box helicase family protein [Streptococcaceae bacterium]|jgi:superfamily II DNA or RNA helicase|nr:DEAD/DEAH box helicase family protein [Streptococcaceae bacterium]
MEVKLILQKKREYKLKNGDSVYLVDILHDYFSLDEFVILKKNEKIFISSKLEFEVNIAQKSSYLKRTTTEKIKLYRSYFRGRDSMIARSFKNAKGKMGYYPWCLIRKKYPCPKVKNQKFLCANCKVQKFMPVTDKIVKDHLRGRDDKGRETFFGLYPIMPDNTVYFLVIDFDKKNWKTEVLAFVKMAKKFQLSPLLEISQSGNGCHTWFFFEKNVPAKDARVLGELLMKHALVENPEISFASFDRMSPNQDELTPNKFGNLIALPLQGSRVSKGFSRFVDEKFNILQDVWDPLEMSPKLSEKQLYSVIHQMREACPVEYYTSLQITDKNPLFEIRKQDRKVSLKQIHITVKNELIISRAKLNAAETVQLKFLATFKNKTFYDEQRKHLLTKNIPQFISLAKIDKEIISLPRGLEEKVLSLFPNAILIDKRTIGKQIKVAFNGQLYPKQQLALKILSVKDMGILSAGTGFGKTVIAAKLIAKKQVSTLVLVHNKNLAAQWKAQLERFLDIEDKPFEEFTKTGRKKKKPKIGKIFGGKEVRSGLVDIGLFQSLRDRNDLEEIMDEYGMVIVDEGHHIAAKTFEDIIKFSKAKYIYGLTATPKREDGLENILFMRLGEIRYKVEKEIPNHVEQKLFVKFTSLGEHIPNIEQNAIHENYNLIVEDFDRNNQIIEDIIINLQEQRHLIVLTRYVNHLNKLKTQLDNRKISASIYILNGKMKTKDLRMELEALKNDGKPFVLLTTVSYAGEGFDLPALDTLLLVMPISGQTSMQQYLGRLLRNLNKKEELRVYDYVDYAIPMIYRMYQKRMRIYKKLGYRLFEDKFTKIYKSNFIDGDYEPILIKDLKIAKKKFVLILPFLNKAFVRQLKSLSANQKVKKIIVIPDMQYIDEKYQQYYFDNIQKLRLYGFEIVFHKKFQQSFVILDTQIIWMLPEKTKMQDDPIALRMYSQDMAKRLENYFKKSQCNKVSHQFY